MGIQEKYGELANQLGPPTRTVMRFAPDDIVSVQGHVASDWLGPPTHLFAAIKDTNPPDPSRFSEYYVPTFLSSRSPVTSVLGPNRSIGSTTTRFRAPVVLLVRE